MLFLSKKKKVYICMHILDLVLVFDLCNILWSSDAIVFVSLFKSIVWCSFCKVILNADACFCYLMTYIQKLTSSSLMYQEQTL